MSQHQKFRGRRSIAMRLENNCILAIHILHRNDFAIDVRTARQRRWHPSASRLARHRDIAAQAVDFYMSWWWKPFFQTSGWPPARLGLRRYDGFRGTDSHEVWLLQRCLIHVQMVLCTCLRSTVALCIADGERNKQA